MTIFFCSLKCEGFAESFLCDVSETEMVGHREEEPVCEIAVAVPKRRVKEGDESGDCVEVLVDEFRKAGLITKRVVGIADEFINVCGLSIDLNFFIMCRSIAVIVHHMFRKLHYLLLGLISYFLAVHVY